MFVARLKSTLKPVVRSVRRRRARPAAERLARHAHPQVAAIGAALLDVLGDGADDGVRRTFGRIEARRAALLASTDEIEMVDFGAGRSSDSRTDDEMAAGVVCRRPVARIAGVSKSAFWARFLHHLVHRLGPASGVELGTCVGISAAYQAAALDRNERGTLRTLEGSPAIADLARETLRELGCGRADVVTGPFLATLDGVLAAAAPLDYMFNDGHHDHDAVLQYFAQTLPHLADSAVIAFDDISWSAGMRRAWEEVAAHPRVLAAIDLHTIGLTVVTAEPAPEKLRATIPL